MPPDADAPCRWLLAMGFTRQQCFEALIAAAKARSTLLNSSRNSSPLLDGTVPTSDVAVSLREDTGTHHRCDTWHCLMCLVDRPEFYGCARASCIRGMRGPSDEESGQCIVWLELRTIPTFADRPTPSAGNPNTCATKAVAGCYWHERE